MPAMRSVKTQKTAEGAKVSLCPKCGGTQFVGKKTLKGMVAGGFVFAPRRLKCVGCGKTLKSG